MAVDDPTDEVLLARHLAGDRDAFAVLLTRHERRVHGVCLRLLGDPEDAADATQEAFLSVLRRAGGFRGGSAFSTWLYRVAVNAALDQGRRRARQRTTSLDRDDRPALDPPAPPGTDPGDAVPTALAVQAALARVPEDYRVALVLGDLYRLPYGEVAEILGVAVGTVKSRVSRGRAALAAALGSLDPRRPDDDAGTGLPASPLSAGLSGPLSTAPAGTDAPPPSSEGTAPSTRARAHGRSRAPTGPPPDAGPPSVRGLTAGLTADPGTTPGRGTIAANREEQGT